MLHADRQTSPYIRFLVAAICTTPSGLGGVCLDEDYVLVGEFETNTLMEAECAAGSACPLVLAEQWSPARVIDRIEKR
jgi:hypothetical protein